MHLLEALSYTSGIGRKTLSSTAFKTFNACQVTVTCVWMTSQHRGVAWSPSSETTVTESSVPRSHMAATYKSANLQSNFFTIILHLRQHITKEDT
jgi:hypothetical protein